MIREIMQDEMDALLALYIQLHPGDIGPHERVQSAWERISSDRGHHIVVAETEGKIVASCVVVVVPNLTHGARPYALVENVVTDTAYRRQGWATRCLDYAKRIAARAGCYKIMLLSGAKEEGTLRFYERAGYNRHDKTAFIQWLE